MSTSTLAASVSLLRPPSRRFGLGVALATPFTSEGRVDLPRLAMHARACLEEGCETVTLAGTTGEGASLGFAERAAMIEALGAAGIDLRARVLVGVASSAIEDAVAQARQLLDAGGRGLLLAPPFYFKDPSEDGLFRWFSAVLERCADARDVILYHIPQVTAVPLSPGLIGRLKTAFPGLVTGVKDSTGDWPTTARLLAEHGDLHILVGDERLLARAVREGGSGAINGFSNFCARALAPIVATGEDVPGLARLVTELCRHPVTPAVKALVARTRDDDGWLAVAPPLLPIGAAARATLDAEFDRFLAASTGA
jgi:4-hydroxy-tetrahydrodipicolinate synthase